MTDPTRDGEPGSTGFAFTRRRLLKTGAAGVAAATAGCEYIDVDVTGNGTPESQGSGPGTEQVVDTELVDDGLTVVRSELVEDPRRVALNAELDRSVRTERYLRVLVRNDLDETVGVVTLSVDLFDGGRRFLEVQLATIESLRSKELFEGYVPFFNRNAEFYVIRARRSRRRSATRHLPDVTATDHCRTDERVHGTVTNDGDTAIERLRVRVRFQDADGNALGSDSELVTDLGSGESGEFAVEFGALFEDGAEQVADYAVDVGDHGPGSLAMR